MTLQRSLRSLFSSKPTRRSHRHHTGPAAVQLLEERVMLSAVTIDLDTSDGSTATGFETSFAEDSTNAVPVVSPNLDIDAGTVAVPAEVFGDDFTGTVEFPPDSAFWQTSGSGGKFLFTDNDLMGNSRLATPPTALRMNPGSVVQTKPLVIDLTGQTDVTIQFVYRNASTSAATPDLEVAYLADGGVNFTPVATISADTNSATFENYTTFSLTLPADAAHEDFRLRFNVNAGSGSPTANDFWYIDDVKIIATDPSSGGGGEVERATVTLAGFDAATETVGFDLTGTSLVETSGGNGTWTFEYAVGTDTSTIDTEAEFEQVLKSITYSTTEQDPAIVTPRAFDFVVRAGGMDSNVATAIVNLVPENDAPVITSVSTTAETFGNAGEGDVVTLTATFTDPESGDTHEAYVNWGDGTPEELVSVDPVTRTVTGMHTYANGGIFDVTLRVVDLDDGVLAGGEDEAATTATITGSGVNDGALQIVGDDTDNAVYVVRWFGEYRVYSDLHSVRTFDVSGITHFEIVTGDGHDYVAVAGNVGVSVVANAGAGNDVIVGGAGDDVLVGGTGDDLIYGRRGNDVLVGGDGYDVLLGGSGDDLLVGGEDTDVLDGNAGSDLLIGGSTAFDADAENVRSRDDIELAQILDDWVAGDSTPETGDGDGLVLGDTVIDDEAFDLLLGGSGADTAYTFGEDWFLGGWGSDTTVS